MPVNKSSSESSKFVSDSYENGKGRAYHSNDKHGTNAIDVLFEIVDKIKRQEAQSSKYLKTGSVSHIIDISKDLEKYAKVLKGNYPALNELLATMTGGNGFKDFGGGIHGLSSNISALDKALKVMKDELKQMATVREVIS